MHSGHYNAIRQSKLLCKQLVVGVNSDQQVLKYKGPTILNDEERLVQVSSCKWVNEVVGETDYICSAQLLDRLNCHSYSHGDDPVIDVDTGEDILPKLAAINRFIKFKRTEGVSTTDITGKLLNLVA
mmetsp:Transcript_1761/g.1200  ORF Transcript_1761/g.1200 Transcript_1761/m.1200 type:complete len:127 (-) Transcript_1761:857-1237(-)